MSGVELRRVNKAFGKALAVRDLDLEVHKGEFLALLGPSGCGKTTTLRLIAGFTRPDSGEILIDGEPVTGMGIRDRRVGIVFQSYALFPNMTAFENIAFGLEVRSVPEDTVRSRVNGLLEMIGLPAFLRCHNSFAVNLDHAVSFRRESFLMKDGTVVPISHAYYAAVREEFQKYHSGDL